MTIEKVFSLEFHFLLSSMFQQTISFVMQQIRPANARIIYFPGFGEDDRIFDELRQELKIPLPEVVVDYHPSLQQFPVQKTSMDTFLNLLMDAYEIKPHDILIGHSFGGWVAHQLRQRIGAEAILICSFTHSSHLALRSRWLLQNKIIVLAGVLHSPFVRWIAYNRNKAKPSAEPITNIFDNFAKTPPEDLYKIMKLVEAKVPGPVVPPSLMMHSRQDLIISPPDEPHISIPGDHFALHEHAALVARKIRSWYRNQAAHSA
mgnify:CR=1 FL=1